VCESRKQSSGERTRLRGVSAPPLRAAFGRLSRSARFGCWRRRLAFADFSWRRSLEDPRVASMRERSYLRCRAGVLTRHGSVSAATLRRRVGTRAPHRKRESREDHYGRRQTVWRARWDNSGAQGMNERPQVISVDDSKSRTPCALLRKSLSFSASFASPRLCVLKPLAPYALRLNHRTGLYAGSGSSVSRAKKRRLGMGSEQIAT
jgi:hypothetical protein